jgi:hypothetical protein
MEKELDELIAKYEEGNMTLITLKAELLRLFSVNRNSTEPKLVKCDNCDEMVEMISTGEFCPCCFC